MNAHTATGSTSNSLSLRCCLLSVESPSMRTSTSRSSRVAATLTTRHHGPLLVFISLASKVADVETRGTAFHCQILHSFHSYPDHRITTESSSPTPRHPFRDMPLPVWCIRLICTLSISKQIGICEMPSKPTYASHWCPWTVDKALYSYNLVLGFFSFVPNQRIHQTQSESITPSNSSTLSAKLACTQHTRS